MGPAVTDREATGPAATGHPATGPAATGRASGHGATGRPLAVRGVVRRTTARATVHGATAREAMTQGGSSPAPRARVVRRSVGGPRDRGPTGAVPAARVLRMRGGLRVLGRSAVVRGRGRAIDSDRVRGRGPGIGGPTSAATGRAMNRGGRTIAGPDRIETTETDRGRAPAKAQASVRAAIARATDRARAGRPVGGRSVARPALAAPVPIDHTARGPRAGARTHARRSSPATAVRPGRRRCHLRRHSAPTRSWWLVGAPSRRRSSLVDRPSASLSSPSGGPPSRSSCSMPRTCGSRSWRSRVAR